MNTAKGVDASSPLLGKGIYDIVEVARMIRRDPGTVARWTQGEDPLYSGAQGGDFGFLDVVSLYVISQLRQRKVPIEEIRTGGEYLSGKLNTPYPFAHQRLATVGGAFFTELEDWYDVGKWGQGAFQTMIRHVLQPIEFGTDELARVWRPAAGVWINPRVQTGTPCIDGTRIPTRVLADLAAAGEPLEEIADDFDLNPAQVANALVYEKAA